MSNQTTDEGVTEVVREIAGVLEPLHSENAVGFAVAHPPRRGVGSAPDPDRVEVRFYCPPRHPRDADRALGMLQGHGYSPDRYLRGGEANICIVLEIDLSGDDGDGPDRPSGESGGEQDTLA